MQIEKAQSSDTSRIISVLRKSIGESKLPKSDEIWRYKHVDNPFGPSLVMVAKESSKIVGVRVFMTWRWKRADKVYDAYRAVDTGVLPNYQRRGIFRKLNIEALNYAKQDGGKFIFNTPNSKSLSGNLKLGWEKIDKVAISLIPVNPIRKVSKYENSDLNTYDDEKLIDLLSNYNLKQDKHGKFYTPKSINFLNWRYKKNPLQTYKVRADKDFFLAVYIKNHQYFKELRVAEHIYYSQKGLNKMKELVFILGKELGAHFISVSPKSDLFKFVFKGKIGPILTLKNLNMDDKVYYKLSNLENWNYTIGDLELF